MLASRSGSLTTLMVLRLVFVGWRAVGGDIGGAGAGVDPLRRSTAPIASSLER
jgi:hypothetical protein